MIHGQVLKLALKTTSSAPVKKGMPVSVKNNSGQAVLVPYTATDKVFIGVALEDSITYGSAVEGYKDYVPSVSYEGVIDCVAGGAFEIGDYVKPAENGFVKANVGDIAVGIALKKSSRASVWTTVLFAPQGKIE